MTATGGDYLLKHSLGIIFVSQPISKVFVGLAEAFLNGRHHAAFLLLGLLRVYTPLQPKFPPRSDQRHVF
jgi:hypothetical protein